MHFIIHWKYMLHRIQASHITHASRYANIRNLSHLKKISNIWHVGLFTITKKESKSTTRLRSTGGGTFSAIVVVARNLSTLSVNVQEKINVTSLIAIMFDTNKSTQGVGRVERLLVWQVGSRMAGYHTSSSSLHSMWPWQLVRMSISTRVKLSQTSHALNINRIGDIVAANHC